MRYTFPALITSSIKLCRRYKNREHVVRTPFLLRVCADHCRRTTGSAR